MTLIDTSSLITVLTHAGIIAFAALVSDVRKAILLLMLPALIVFALELRMPKTVMIQVFNFCFLLKTQKAGNPLLGEIRCNEKTSETSRFPGSRDFDHLKSNGANAVIRAVVRG